MKANKLITQELDIQIDGVTLLSVDEFILAKDKIAPLSDDWFLRSDKANRLAVAKGFHAGGEVANTVEYVEYPFKRALVRPVLNFSGCTELGIGDRFVLSDYEWVVVLEGKALCRTSHWDHPYRVNRECEDCEEACFTPCYPDCKKIEPSENFFDYNHSAVKSFLRCWVRSML